MIPYLDRDLLRSFLLTFFVLMAFIQVGYLVSVLLENSSYIFGADESKLGWVLLYYAVTIPRQASYAIPVVTSVSLLWVYTQKSRQNETLAYLSGGVGPPRLALPLIVAAFLFSIATYMIIEYLANPAERYAYRIERINIQDRGLDTLTREQDVFQKGRGNRFYSIREFEPTDSTMDAPIIIDMGPRWSSPVWRLDADSAERTELDGKAEWVFYDAVFRRFTPEGTVSQFTQRPRLSESDLGVKLEEELTRYLRQRFKPDQMGFHELRDYIELFEIQGKPTAKLRTRLHFNFAIPLSSFILSILMCGHILRPSAAGVVVGFGGGLVIIAVYFASMIAFRTMAVSGAVDPIFGAYTPALVGLVIGIMLLKRYRPA